MFIIWPSRGLTGIHSLLYSAHDGGDRVWLAMLTAIMHNFFYRSTVMILLALLDPKGTAQRKSRKLNRRVYRSKVYIFCFENNLACLIYRDPIMYGTVMEWINLNHMVYLSTHALMGTELL